jgi:2'-5' RNA ligase
MRVAIAFLAGIDFSNCMTRISMRLRSYGFGFRVLRLRPHVSMKQPFVVEDFPRFEQYFDNLAARIEPQEMQFDGYRFWQVAEVKDEGVVVLHVAPNARLQQLHRQLNAELESEFGGTQAAFDGDAYEAHLTVGIGPYDRARRSELEQALKELGNERGTIMEQLGMFVYEEIDRQDSLYGRREWGMYQVRDLLG